LAFKNKKTNRKPTAILQLINKKDNKLINDFDIGKMLAIAPLIGSAIENASELHSVINVRLGVN
jgi:hypothetical protein